MTRDELAKTLYPPLEEQLKSTEKLVDTTREVLDTVRALSDGGDDDTPANSGNDDEHDRDPGRGSAPTLGEGGVDDNRKNPLNFWLNMFSNPPKLRDNGHPHFDVEVELHELMWRNWVQIFLESEPDKEPIIHESRSLWGGESHEMTDDLLDAEIETVNVVDFQRGVNARVVHEATIRFERGRIRYRFITVSSGLHEWRFSSTSPLGTAVIRRMRLLGLLAPYEHSNESKPGRR